MKKVLLVTTMLVALVSHSETYAQTWLRQLGNAAKNAAKNAVEKNVERAAEKAVDKTFQTAEQAAEDAITGKNRKQETPTQPETGQPAQPAAQTQNPTVLQSAVQQEPTADETLKAVEAAYAKSDFVPGDEIIFEDLVENEQLGEFPSMWDLAHGNVEVASINNEKVIMCISQDDPVIMPLFDEMKSYLPEKFTIEFDFWVGAYAKDGENNPSNRYIIRFYRADSNNTIQKIDIDDWYYDESDHRTRLSWEFCSLTDEWRSGTDESFRTIPNSWNHFALSFNKRAMKAYINGTRFINIPNTVAPGWFDFQFYRSGGYFTNNTSIRNIRIAKGAVPLYDRMMSDGKFITYGITFDIGKSTIKPESMGEINRIVTLMNENPDLKFSVEGHTDSTGNPASNQTLSEARSQAIVDKLVESGIARERLSATGKGQSNPIADNSTDEGRAKNRRVEFVKL